MADDEERECEVMDYQEGSLMENELVTKQNTKSHIWNNFGFEPDESGKPRSKDHPKCRLCKTEIAAKDGNTSNLFSHLKNKHPEEYHRIRNLAGKVEKHQEQSFRQPLLETSWDKRKLLSSSSHEYKELTKSVTYWRLFANISYLQKQKICQHLYNQGVIAVAHPSKHVLIKGHLTRASRDCKSSDGWRSEKCNLECTWNEDLHA